MFNIIQTERGIGDIICSLYAIQGLAVKFPMEDINFFSPQHSDWAQLAEIPKMKARKYYEKLLIDKPLYLYRAEKDIDKQKKHTNSPKNLFASELGVLPQRPALREKIASGTPIFDGDYVVLSPFASRLNRTWEVQNWRILSKELTKAGFRVIALDGRFQGNRCKNIGAEYYWGQKAEWTANVCLNATMIISNDSGMAHLGGWLGTKTLVIMSQLFPEQFYDLTNNRFVIPKQKCIACRFIKQYGYEEKCDWGCWALQSISPNEVLDRILTWLSEKEVK